MDFTICYLEVFNEETKEWEYQFKSDNPEPINCWYNNLESFFEAFNLSYLFKAMENKEQSKGNRLPKDCSKPIVNAHHFYFEEVNMCQSVSYFDIIQLFNFDYDKTIDITEIAKKDIQLFRFEIFDSEKQTISHKEWLGEDFFIELQETKQQFCNSSKCRIIYFLYEIVI